MNKPSLAAIFSDGLVFQRNQQIKIFGKAPENMTICATVKGMVLGTQIEQISMGETIATDGRFEITLPPLKEGVSHQLVVSEKGSSDAIVRTDIAIGEVWIAGGQSNMEFELGNCDERDILLEEEDTDIRFYYTLKTGEITPEFEDLESKTHWEKFGDAGTTHWSAVATFFARKLKSKLSVPIGIIGCNWGGTSASGWMPIQALETTDKKTYADLTQAIEDSMQDVSAYLRLYEKETEGRDEERQRLDYKAYEKRAAEFDLGYQELLKKNPQATWDDAIAVLGPNGWPGPMGVTNPYRPGGLYDCMVSRILPYQTKGVLFYQGESDELFPHLYEALFTRLIACWREGFQNENLPFVFALLPMHRYEFEPIGTQWCLIREAQMDVARKVANAYVTNIIDQGVYNDIHPTAKQVVGERMCEVTLYHVYQLSEKEKAYGPMLTNAKTQGNCIKLSFSKLEKEVFVGKEKAKDITLQREKLPGFELAGEDQVYYEARADFIDGAIVLSSEKVPAPKYARYLWYEYGDTFLYDADHLPMFPFRTSRDDGFVVTYHADLVKRIKETGSRA